MKKGKREMKIATTVMIDKNWQQFFEPSDNVFSIGTAFHIHTDPIDGKKRCTIFTDDGKGNGLPILEFEME
jgi:hypothetical protein